MLITSLILQQQILDLPFIKAFNKAFRNRRFADKKLKKLEKRYFGKKIKDPRFFKPKNLLLVVFRMHFIVKKTKIFLLKFLFKKSQSVRSVTRYSNLLLYFHQPFFYIYRRYLISQRLNLGNFLQTQSLKLLLLNYFLRQSGTSYLHAQRSLIWSGKNKNIRFNYIKPRSAKIYRIMYFSSFRFLSIRHRCATLLYFYKRYQYRLTRFFLSFYKFNFLDFLYYLSFKASVLIDQIFKFRNDYFLNWLFSHKYVLLNNNFLFYSNYMLSAYDCISIRINYFLYFLVSRFLRSPSFMPQELFKHLWRFHKRKGRVFPKTKSHRLSNKILFLEKLKSFFGVRFVQICFHSFSFILLFIKLTLFYFINNFLVWRLPFNAMRNFNWKWLS